MFYATREHMQKLDDLAVENGLHVRQMMELAGWAIVPLFQELKKSADKRIGVVVGKGNKGGDGLCAARHLVNAGHEVTIIMVRPDISPDAAHQLELLQKMEVHILFFEEHEDATVRCIAESDILIDALIGYNLVGAPRSNFAHVITHMNESSARMVSYDIPSGMDASPGECFAPCITADVTLTLALPKRAFLQPAAKKYFGSLYLADIGIPSFLYDAVEAGSRPPFIRPLLYL